MPAKITVAIEMLTTNPSFSEKYNEIKETREKKKPSKLDKYKSTCEEIGFTPGTEKFGDCVMKLMDKD